MTLRQLSVGLEDAQRAIGAAMNEARRDGRPMAFVVADANGDPISCARMDGAHERVLRFALRKAYTAAIMGRGTTSFKKELTDRGRTLADYGDAQFTTLQGGLPVKQGDQVIGAVAAGGNSQERDEAIAEAAVRALLEGLDVAGERTDR